MCAAAAAAAAAPLLNVPLALKYCAECALQRSMHAHACLCVCVLNGYWLSTYPALKRCAERALQLSFLN